MRKNCSDIPPLLILALVAFSQVSMARDMMVTVTDRDGEPVPNVAVYVDAPGSGESPTQTATA